MCQTSQHKDHPCYINSSTVYAQCGCIIYKTSEMIIFLLYYLRQHHAINLSAPPRHCFKPPNTSQIIILDARIKAPKRHRGVVTLPPFFLRASSTTTPVEASATSKVGHCCSNSPRVISRMDARDWVTAAVTPPQSSTMCALYRQDLVC